MSRRGSAWVRRSKPQQPPVDGIKLGKAGATWWGKRWIEALEQVLHGDAARLRRGRTYARAGHTHALEIRGGQVTARVTGSRPRPYRIRIQVGQLSDRVWQAAIAQMAAQAQFAAELLAGQMPKQIDDVFRAAGASLFPSHPKDLLTSCTCPDDWGDPCKHVAATHYVLGEALDRDPFLLFALRGRTKEEVLAALREARHRQGQSTAAPVAPAPEGTQSRPSGQTPARRKRMTAPAHNTDDARTSTTAGAMPAASELPSVMLEAVTAEAYERVRAPLPALHHRFDTPAQHGAVLRQLGQPVSWHGAMSPVDVLSPLVSAAARTARRMAMAEPPPQGAAADSTGAAAAEDPQHGVQ